MFCHTALNTKQKKNVTSAITPRRLLPLETWRRANNISLFYVSRLIVLTPSLSGGRRVRPNLDLDTVRGCFPCSELGTKASASGFRDFFFSVFWTAVLVFFSAVGGGAGSAKPNAGFRRSTVITCSLFPTLTLKNFSPLSVTRNGPSYGRVRGVLLAPCLMKTNSALLSAVGTWALGAVVCHAVSGYLAAAMSAFRRTV